MKEENLGPVRNPDGSPSDLTVAMLAGTGRDPVAFVAGPPAKPKTIKVRVEMTIEVDLDDYRLNYGDETVDVIRADVRWAVLNAVTSGGVIADGIVGASLKVKGSS